MAKIKVHFWAALTNSAYSEVSCPGLRSVLVGYGFVEENRISLPKRTTNRNGKWTRKTIPLVMRAEYGEAISSTPGSGTTSFDVTMLSNDVL